MKSLLLLTLLLVGCGKNTLQVDPEIRPYVTRFESASVAAGHPIQVVDLVAQFGDIGNSGEEGKCDLGSGKTPTITIDRLQWDHEWISADIAHERVVFHELGHCILRREHSKIQRPNGQIGSLMYSAVGYVLDYPKSREGFLYELFNPGDISHE